MQTGGDASMTVCHHRTSSLDLAARDLRHRGHRRHRGLPGALCGWAAPLLRFWMWHDRRGAAALGCHALALAPAGLL